MGVFWNVGDRVELDEDKVNGFLQNKKIKISQDLGKSGKIYELTDAQTLRKERASALLKAVACMRGGSKQAAFGTDVAPKVMILAGTSCGNPIFNSLFIDDGTGPVLKVDTLKEVARDYSNRLMTPIFIGVRKGYLKNEPEVLQLEKFADKGVSFKITTPIDCAEQMSNALT